MAQPDKTAKLLAELANTSWDGARMARRRLTELLTSGVVIALVGLFLVNHVITHWPSGDWWSILSQGCGGVAIVGGFLLSLSSVRRDWAEQQQMRTAALALRAAAEEGDEHLAPLAAEQPAPLSPAALATGPERFALFGSWKSSAVVSACVGVLLLVLAAGLGAVMVLMLSGNHPDSGFPLVAQIVGGVLLFLGALAGIVGGVIFLLHSWLQPCSVYLEADERGLRWWRSGWQHLRPTYWPWDAARSFFVIASAGTREADWRKAYVLDAHDSLLTWRVTSAMSKEQVAMLERFHRLVVTRARLPLRDLSAAAAQVVRVAGTDEISQPAGDP
jgi:hypothetical protein